MKKPIQKVPSEQFEQLRLVAWLKAKGLRFTHVVGNAASKRAGARNKALGMSPGFPDLLVLVGGFVLAIELKRQRGGRASPEQLAWVEALTDHGVPAFVCCGFEKARELIEGYL